jgi:aryl-alcohol dehydrogenase-like predicted oxidoreductase
VVGERAEEAARLKRATAQGTEAFQVEALKRGIAPEHFREVSGLKLSSLGIGTYLGEGDDETDELYRRAVADAVHLGANVIDTAINYRHQRSERAVGRAISDLSKQGVEREQLVVCTKGGYIPFDSAPPADARGYVKREFFDKGLLKPEEVQGGHALAPRFLRNQVERSLENLGLGTLDVYYLHNPETQLASVDRETFLRKLRAAFECLEEMAAEGAISFYGTATWNGYRRKPAARDFLSLHELAELARGIAGEEHRFRFVQLPYNLAMTEAFTETNQPTVNGSLSLCQAASSLGFAVMASASIAQGQLHSGLPDWLGTLFRGLKTDAQRALQFVRSTPGVTTALVGMKTPEHVRENLEAARLAPAPMEDFLKLFEIPPSSDAKN